MKIQCDVCSKKEASVFCSADEAALCDVCDQRVHHANKLASKHDRFSLLHCSPSLAPLCDICQEKRAHVFCQQDRAILCRDCELPLHSANEHTQKHNRFLLTGIKLSPICDDNINNNSFENPSAESGFDPVPDFKQAKKPISCEISPVHSNNENLNQQLGCCGGSTSSISEYLIEMLPGWHFEDFFLDSAPFSLSKSGYKNGVEVAEDMVSFLDVDLDKELRNSTQFENLGIRVPEATVVFDQGLTKQQETSVNGIKVNRKWKKDESFTVPQIIQSVGSNNKRPRTFW